MSELIVIVWFVFSLICFFVRMKDKKSTIQQLEIKNTYYGAIKTQCNTDSVVMIRGTTFIPDNS